MNNKDLQEMLEKHEKVFVLMLKNAFYAGCIFEMSDSTASQVDAAAEYARKKFQEYMWEGTQ